MGITIHKAAGVVIPSPTAEKIPVVMGIDPSTNTGVVALRGNEILYAGKVVETELTGFKRLHSIASQVGQLLYTHAPDGVFIERPTNQGFNVPLIASIGALIRNEVYTRGMIFWDVAPSSLKLWVTGKGNAKKADVKKAVLSRWNIVKFKGDNNVVDAYALARLGQHVLGNPTKDLKGVTDHEGH